MHYGKCVGVSYKSAKQQYQDIKGMYVVLYRSPSVNENEFIDAFLNWCGNYLDFESFKVICGDFNINLFSETSSSKRMKSALNSLGLKQVVIEPTRVTKTSKTLIDYVVTNNYNMKAAVLFDEKISDHSTICFNAGMYKPKKIKAKYVDKLVKYSKEKFINNLLNIEWDKMYEMNVNDKLNYFSENLKKCISEFVKKVKVNCNNGKDWYKNEMFQKRIQRDNLYKKAYITGENDDWEEYNKNSTEYQKTITIIINYIQ